MSIITKVINHEIVTTADFPPVRVDTGGNAYEVDRVRVELTWFGKDYAMQEEGDEIGWYVDVDVKGWILTKTGKRNSRYTNRETVFVHRTQGWPAVVHEAAVAAYESALAQGAIDWRTVLGDDGKPGTTKTLL